LIAARAAFFLIGICCAGSAVAGEVTLIPAGTPPRLACGDAPPDWRLPGTDERAFSERVAAPDGGVGCARTQLLRWRFTMPEGTPRALLTLRARYQHGFVAYLDGMEVARRRLPPDAALDTLASDLHGPEWERIPVATAALGRSEPHVLAVEVHPRTLGREPMFDVELLAGAGPRIVHGPYLLDVTTRGARIALETDVATTVELEHGPTDALGTQAVEVGGGLGRRHVFTISGLRAATSYRYRVTARAPGMRDAASTEVIAFHTMPEQGRPLRFVIYGDVRSGHDVHAQVARAIRAEDPDLAISTGDLVDMGSDEADWDRYFELAAPLIGSVPVYTSPGNHEYARAGRGAERYRVLFGLGDRPGPGWYAFDVAGVHFISLDSNQYRSAEQLSWLKADLQQARSARAIFAFAHEPAFSSGVHGDNEIAKAQYVPLLEQHGVTFYIGGHDHHYERGKVGRLEYIVSGGGGAELRGQRCGMPGKKACPQRVAVFANEHHYIVVEVLPGLVRLCPRRPDGSPIEACFTRPLRR